MQLLIEPLFILKSIFICIKLPLYYDPPTSISWHQLWRVVGQRIYKLLIVILYSPECKNDKKKNKEFPRLEDGRGVGVDPKLTSSREYNELNIESSYVAQKPTWRLKTQGGDKATLKKGGGVELQFGIETYLGCYGSIEG